MDSLTIRVIYDRKKESETRDDRVYLSIEGNIQEASETERLSLKSRLSDACAVILGIDEPDEKDETTPFKAAKEDETIPEGWEIEPEEKPEAIKEKTAKPQEKETEKPIKAEDENSSEEEPFPYVFKQGPMKGKTPKEALDEKPPKMSVENWFRIMRKNIQRYEKETKEAMNKEIDRLEKQEKEGSFSIEDLIDAIEEKAEFEQDQNHEVLDTLCGAFGSNWEEIKANGDVKVLTKIYLNYTDAYQEANKGEE